MNSRGETQAFGYILIAFVAIIVGVVLFQAVAQQAGTATNTVAVANESLGSIAVNGTPQYLTDIKSLSSVVIYNETGEVVVPSTNYTITNNVVYNGQEAVEITPNASSTYLSVWQVSGTGQPLTYISDSGSRSVVGLIAIFFALAVAVVALEPTLRSGVLDMIGK